MMMKLAPQNMPSPDVSKRRISHALAYLDDGVTMKQLAERSGISVTTVREGLCKIRRRMKHPRPSEELKPIRDKITHMRLHGEDSKGLRFFRDIDREDLNG